MLRLNYLYNNLKKKAELCDEKAKALSISLLCAKYANMKFDCMLFIPSQLVRSNKQ